MWLSQIQSLRRKNNLTRSLSACDPRAFGTFFRLFLDIDAITQLRIGALDQGLVYVFFTLHKLDLGRTIRFENKITRDSTFKEYQQKSIRVFLGCHSAILPQGNESFIPSPLLCYSLIKGRTA
jgi:hypothetical protein